MAYFLYGPNSAFGTINPYSCFTQPYFYSPYDSFSTFTPIVQSQGVSNFQASYQQNNWFGPEIKISDTREGSSDFTEANSSQKIKSSNMNKVQKRNRNVQKELQSAKKNCQSNLVNQFLSYFSSFNNSSVMVIKALQKMTLEINISERKQFQEITIFFCKQISIVNSRRQRKYVNKSFLQNYFTVEKLQKYMPDILERVQKFQLLSKEQFVQLFRRCCYNFFRTVSVSSVTSSAKLNQISRPQHIKRRRLIVQTLGKK